MMMLKPAPSGPDADCVTEAAGRTSDVRGVIDNATPDRLYGWAWDFGHPAHRVQVVLRIAGETMAEAVADGARPDLAKGGIGDGCHAFELPLRPEWRDRLQELAVVARGVDGREFPIAVRLPRIEPKPPGNQLQRTVETLLAEQRALQREVAELRGRAGRDQAEQDEARHGDAARDDAGQAEASPVGMLQQRVDHLELWLTRLDARLAELAAPPPPAARSGLDPWQAVLYALLASLVVGALAAAAARWLG